MGLFSFVTGKRRSRHDLVNIASPDFKAKAYPFYARLRAEAPVYRITLPIGESPWLITRYEDVATTPEPERQRRTSLAGAQARTYQIRPSAL